MQHYNTIVFNCCNSLEEHLRTFEVEVLDCKTPQTLRQAFENKSIYLLYSADQPLMNFEVLTEKRTGTLQTYYCELRLNVFQMQNF